ncbi:Hypothetical protein D9617_1g079990 [Elsinoe fawcettii]|nr:Hypothetical protein D9617_1g079990 [Elsinoe fawcettii]
MKVSAVCVAIAAGTALAVPTALPVAEPGARVTERDGTSLVTYAVGGFRITDLQAVIKPWSLFTTTTGNNISFTAQPLSSNYQNLGSPISCSKTWTDSILRGTGNIVVGAPLLTSGTCATTNFQQVKCSDPNMSFSITRNMFYSYQFSVNLAYTLVRVANSTAGTQYNTNFILNEKSVQLKCLKDKTNAQSCSWSGTGLSASTLSSKSVS